MGLGGGQNVGGFLFDYFFVECFWFRGFGGWFFHRCELSKLVDAVRLKRSKFKLGIVRKIWDNCDGWWLGQYPECAATILMAHLGTQSIYGRSARRYLDLSGNLDSSGSRSLIYPYVLDLHYLACFPHVHPRAIRRGSSLGACGN